MRINSRSTKARTVISMYTGLYRPPTPDQRFSKCALGTSGSLSTRPLRGSVRSKLFSHKYAVKFYWDYLICDITVEWAQKQIWEFISSNTPDTKEIFKKCETMPLFLLIVFTLENTIIFFINHVNVNMLLLLNEFAISKWINVFILSQF